MIRRLVVLGTLTALLLSGCAQIENVISFGAGSAVGPPALPDPTRAGTASCVGRLNADERGAPPLALPALTGATAMRAGTRDGQAVYTAFLRGEAAQVSSVGNLLIESLRSLGFVVGSLPPSRNATTATFRGRLNGQLLIQPLCRGYLAYRFSVNTGELGPPDLPKPEVAATSSCEGRLAPDPYGKPPIVPIPQGATALRNAPVGDEVVYTLYLRGAMALVPAIRSALVSDLRGLGFIVGVDPVEPTSARASFAGVQRGRLLVQPFCRGYLAVRYFIQNGVRAPVALLDPVQAETASCSGRLVVDPAGAIPAELVSPQGATPMPAGLRNGELVYTAFLRGRAQDVGNVRSGLLAGLRTSGFEVSTDPIKPALATGVFSGSRHGSVRVQPLCRDYLAVRFNVAPIDPEPPDIAANASCEGRLRRFEGARLAADVPTVPGITILRVVRDAAGTTYEGFLLGGYYDVGAIWSGLIESFNRTPGLILGVAPLGAGEGAFAWRHGRGVTHYVYVRPLCTGHILVRYRINHGS